MFNIDIEICRECGGAITVIACIEDPVVNKKILAQPEGKALLGGAHPAARETGVGANKPVRLRLGKPAPQLTWRRPWRKRRSIGLPEGQNVPQGRMPWAGSAYRDLLGFAFGESLVYKALVRSLHRCDFLE